MCSPGCKDHEDLTSSPPSSRISRAVSPECPALPDGNRRRGLRSLRDLTQHLTTRADDSHAAPVYRPRREGMFPYLSGTCQTPVRFFALRRIEPHAPPLVRGPVNSFEFQPCDRTPQAGVLNALTAAQKGSVPPTPSTHRLRLGLPGYLILFAPLAFAPQRQLWPRRPPSLLVFFLISTHSTATPGIPSSSTKLKIRSSDRSSPVEPVDFTIDPRFRLRALYAQ